MSFTDVEVASLEKALLKAFPNGIRCPLCGCDEIGGLAPATILSRDAAKSRPGEITLFGTGAVLARCKRCPNILLFDSEAVGVAGPTRKN